MLYRFPPQASVNRPVPKARIYEHSKVGSALRNKFISQVEAIVWAYKLAPETINLASTPAVPEIQVFDIVLKAQEVDDQVLLAIDRAIPFPIIFRLHHGNRVRVVAAYKRPSEVDASQWVIEGYVSSEWVAADVAEQPLPQALDLQGLYHQLLRSFMDEPGRPGEPLSDHLQRSHQLRVAHNDYRKLESRLQKEKQFNRKVSLNAELRAVQQRIDQLRQL